MEFLKKYRHQLIIFEILASIIIMGAEVYLLICLRDEYDPMKIRYLKNNWNQRPIKDIKTIEMNSTCDLGYENLFKNEEYPGLVNSCECGEIVNDTIGSLCYFGQINIKCNNINSKGSSKILNYKNKIWFN